LGSVLKTKKATPKAQIRIKIDRIMGVALYFKKLLKIIATPKKEAAIQRIGTLLK
jgi:hypothetical protein